ncbi:hypothetical protein [Pseudobacteriovorax antillogorgiicola]|uniref:Asparagine synthase n=1 Tax=Pseudobacteriovorax antillogorgiicola TaxID=1513793 RepID=A0A1Y6C365_9BACT|nr:hypothetical protein [Pseudobacteriovorax antillogorgiicola]TCS50624.1 hypothetical protein EDD56_1123 [Pseudobacteriovorax antillogorgiicola]SMF39400.1 hypothetical protein SAMN06296036_1122 [Pseudobacteriovorax antillogorgiicola]
MNGRFVLVYRRGASPIKVLNDACGLRSVFYSDLHSIKISSHPNLLAERIGSERNGLAKYLSIYTGYHPPANTTPWYNIFQLIPNHYLDTSSKALKRFFPREELIQRLPTESSRNEIAEHLANQVNLLKDENLLCSITAGIDSRVTLSATKKHSRNIHYFTYFGGTGEAEKILSTDRKVVSDIVDNLQLNHTFFRLRIEEDLDIQAVLEKQMSESHLIHNKSVATEFIKRFRGKNYLHLRSNLLEITRHFYRNVYRLKNKYLSLIVYPI